MQTGEKVSFHNWTDRARKVAGFSRREAELMKLDQIGTEHLLLGLLIESSGVATNVLENLGVDLERVKTEIKKMVACGSSKITKADSFTSRSQTVIKFADEEREALGHNYLGTEHLLLGLIREREGIGAQILLGLGVKLKEVQVEIMELLGHTIEPFNTIEQKVAEDCKESYLYSLEDDGVLIQLGSEFSKFKIAFRPDPVSNIIMSWLEANRHSWSLFCQSNDKHYRLVQRILSSDEYKNSEELIKMLQELGFTTKDD